MKKFLLVSAFACFAFADSPEPKPAFPEQTDAPAPPKSADFDAQIITDKLNTPWSLAFLPDGSYLVTEGGGTLRVVSKAGAVSAPIAGVPGVKSVGAEGFHEVVLDPDFARTRLIYFTYFAPVMGQAPGSYPLETLYDNVWAVPLAERRTMKIGREKVARARLSEDLKKLENVEVIGDGMGERRMVVARDGSLFISGGDRFWLYESKLDGMEHPFLDNPDERRNFTGRVMHINRDGTYPKDNPWLSRSTVLPETYAHGLKDPEGLAIHPQTGELWLVDHGPQGGDEINIIKPGKDYGWPNVSYGRQYDARQADKRTNVIVGTGKTSMDGVEEPRYYWVPSIAPSGMMFYTGDLFPAWKNNLFVGAMAGQHLVRLVLNGDKVVGEEKLLVDRKWRIREVKQGPDGAIYIFAGNQLVRLAPKK
ncbi:MAG: PQQ-dependent sugar dehydrogenase [Acidobacteriota bacterium]